MNYLLKTDISSITIIIKSTKNGSKSLVTTNRTSA